MSNQTKPFGKVFVDGLNDMYSNLGAQMAAPFYILSDVFLPTGKLSTDVRGLMTNEEENTCKQEMFALKKSEMLPEVYLFLEKKAQENQLSNYITKLVLLDMHKPDKEEYGTLLDSLRNEFLGEIHNLKRELALSSVDTQTDELRDYVTKLVEQNSHKSDKAEFRSLLDSLRNEFLGEIHNLKKELAIGPAAVDHNTSRPVLNHEEMDDMKEGQLLESDRVIGTIKEVIDVDF